MNQKQAFQLGKHAGYNAAIYAEVTDSDREDAGCICIEAEDITDQVECEECIMSAAYECEQNARQHSPFEFTAHEINTGRNPEGQWSAYDSGVEAGIKAGIKKRLTRVAA
jgi:hypothetical protein